MSESEPADGFAFITDDDLEKLGAIAEQGPGTISEEEDEKPLRDPADEPPRRHGQNRYFGKAQSRALVELSERTTIAEAAEHCGVTERTVERHRAYWMGHDDSEAVKLEVTTQIDGRLCAAMRCACHDGEAISAVAEYFDVSRGAAYNHVSANADFECSHDPPVEVERVEFKHGGMRGSPERRICSECGQFTGEAEGHEC